MKRFVLVICMVLAVFVLFACGKGGTRQEKMPSGTQAGVAADPAGSSDGAVGPWRPDLSDNEAFSVAEDLVKGMTLEEKVGQMFMVGLSDTGAGGKAPAKHYRLTKRMKEMLLKYHIGGVYLTEANIKNEDQAGKLVSDIQACASGSPLYVAVEEEGGEQHSFSARVKDMEGIASMSPGQMASGMTVQQVYGEGNRVAARLTSLGINMNLAPVADIASEMNPTYAPRCFGGDVDAISEKMVGFEEGMRDAGLAVVLKYFPGVGNVPGDMDEEIRDNKDSLMTLRDNNFSIYSDGIKAGADCVMVANVAVSRITVNDKLPAFLSEDIVTGILREEMGFEGVIMTSPLNVEAVTKSYTVEYMTVEAVKAGCDMIFLPENVKKGYDALLGAVVTGKLDEKVINTCVRRILQNKIQRGIIRSSE